MKICAYLRWQPLLSTVAGDLSPFRGGRGRSKERKRGLYFAESSRIVFLIGTRPQTKGILHIVFCAKRIRRVQPRQETTPLDPIQIGIIFLTVATASIHIVLAIPHTLVMFYLNGLGYLVLLAALFAPQFRDFHRLIRWVLIGYAALTVVLWVRIGERSVVGYIDKLIEIALIGLLWVEEKRSNA